MEVVQSDFLIPEINYNIQISIEDSCMIAPEQLYKSIPKKVEQWDAKDVQKWFSINNFQTSKEFSFQTQEFDGKALIAVSPEYLLSVCGVATRLIMKKIIEWLEYDREEFEEYVDEHPNEELRVDLNEYISLSKPASTQYVSSSSEDRALQAFPTQKNKEKAPYRNYLRQAIKHQESILPIMEVQKWKKKKKQLSEEYSLDKKSVSKSNLHKLNSINSNRSENYIPNGASFIQSSYEIRHVLLQFSFDKQVILLQNSGKIGRQTDNDVINVSQSVSRYHAEVIKDGDEFYIKDIGSRFGTFIEIGKPFRKVLEVGDIIAFEDTQIEIMNFTYYSKQNTFDLKIRKEDQKEFETFLRKRVVTVGSNQGKDIKISDSRIKPKHALITIDSYGNLIIKAQEGVCFRKLRTNQLFKIEQHDNILRLGLTEVNIKIVHNTKPVPNISEFASERF